MIKNNIIKKLFNHPVLNLDKQVRYSNLKVMFPENVAEHSQLVASIAMILAIELMKENKGLNIDIKDIAYRGVIHDWGESVTCDVTSDCKYSNPELPKILEDIESKGLRKLFDSENFIQDINRAREGCIEGDLIMLADRFQSFCKMMKEYMIQRTDIWRASIENNSIPCVIRCINNIITNYGISRDGILNEMINGLIEVKEIIDSKIDFL